MPTPIPGPKGLPFFGLLFEASGDPFEYAETLRAYGDVVRVPFPQATFLYLLHPDHIARVLLHNQKNYGKGRHVIERGRLLLGDGLVISEGDLWRRQRTRMAPAFMPRRVEAFGPGMLDRIGATLNLWSDGEVRSVNDDMMTLTLDMALGALFGASGGEDLEIVRAAFREITEFFARPSMMFGVLPLWLPTPANLRYKRALAQLEGVSTRILTARRAAADRGTDLLGLLLEGQDDDGSAMDDRQLRDELRTLIMAGHETTAVALTATLWLLAGHPEIQEAAANDPATAERAFKEGLRLYPPVPFFFREALADDTMGDHLIPAGSTLALSPWMLQRDPRFFPDPRRFDPDRWLGDSDRPRFHWFPFGGGPRVCIGQGMAMLEGRLVLGEILKRFKIERADDGPLEVEPALTLRFKKPVRLRLTTRRG